MRIRTLQCTPFRVVTIYKSGLRVENQIPQDMKRIRDVVSKPIKVWRRNPGSNPPTYRYKRVFRQENECTNMSVTSQGNAIVHSDDQLVQSHFNFGSTGSIATAGGHIVGGLSNYINFGKFDFQKNNNFELIPTLFDLDKTIDTFTKKLFKSVSYGQVTWELLPLWSDINSLIDTVKDMSGRIGSELEAVANLEKTFPVNYDAPDRSETFRGHVTFRGTKAVKPRAGYNDFLDALDSAAIFADELGIHPDLKTVWDIIPLSFVVDYFVPVGDYLESLHPRGWYDPEFQISGFATLKGTVRRRETVNVISKHPYMKGKLYARNLPVSFSKKMVKLKVPEWDAPSARQLFNTEYLRRTIRRDSLARIK